MTFGHDSRALRLHTLAWLRWLAIGGQTVTVLTVALVFGFPLPLFTCVALIGGLAALNLALSLRYPSTQRLSPEATLALLSIDLLQLAGLLYVTGGLGNPFAPLLCVPVIISFAAQPLRYSLALFAIALAATTALAFSIYEVPWYPGEELYIQPIMQTGMWCAVIATMAFAAFYVYRISSEATQLADALAATELILQREKHLTQLDGLAAAAAHELGTPLATITLVAKEMERELGPDDRFGEDVALLRSQSERCRDILRRLTSLSAEGEEHMRFLPLSSLVEEVMAPHRDFGVTLELVEKSGRAGEPVGNRNPGILYGLGNLLENAVDFAREKVTVTVEHTRERVTILISDDGEGYAPDVLAHIGEPYVTKRSRPDKAGGLGLGMFIAKTLLERSGARLEFYNGPDDRPGANVRIEWPRARMEAVNGK
ncbi:ActS/PrrB/RegB family redox-sensitive histidine kinase [Rhizobiaceae bacterium BDR2-2]|uniref:histidine kinase n=2 Tax=Ectorhizobium quercum TaxID=2965071 RepID=A0AAE3SXT2_9HYPH|nr:ActS/PrrB/RegB family redox-sensitive histidine kinase [Ectorhizobium quercum]